MNKSRQAERKIKTVFNDPQKHAEFIEHIKDMHHRDREHGQERERRCGDENYPQKIFNIVMPLL